MEDLKEIRELFTKLKVKKSGGDIDERDRLLILSSLYLTQFSRVKDGDIEAINEIENLGKSILINFTIDDIKKVASEFGVLKDME
jgi:hypothetical protein